MYFNEKARLFSQKAHGTLAAVFPFEMIRICVNIPLLVSELLICLLIYFLISFGWRPGLFAFAYMHTRQICSKLFKIVLKNYSSASGPIELS